VQAAADVDSAMGEVINAGAYPNPTVGYEADTVGSAGTRNYQGMFFTQTIKTAGKLELAQASANVGLMNAQLALRKARIDLITRVRTQYFAALIARQAVTINTALVRFTNEVYRVQVEQVKGGQAAPYEPMQLRALAMQARSFLVQAQNRYASSWKQLAATLGIPDLPLSDLEGQPDMQVPVVDFNAATDYLTSNHTDILSARNGVHQARIDLRLQEVTPIPDVQVYSAIQKDYTTPPVTRTTYNLQVGVPLPIFNRNRGGILSAQGKLIRASEEVARTRNDLLTQLADAFERYETNRVLADYYKNQILPDQTRVYRGIYDRHQQEPDAVGFSDVVVAQQNLLNSLTTYIAALTAQWQAVTDIGGLLQVENLYEIELPGGARSEPAAAPPAEVPAVPAVPVAPPVND
jgi:cobalt-zinc-cadmium efflux system outer membrane protein